MPTQLRSYPEGMHVSHYLEIEYREHNLSGILLERLIFMTTEKMSLSNVLLVTGHDIFMDNKLQTAVCSI